MKTINYKEAIAEVDKAIDYLCEVKRQLIEEEKAKTKKHYKPVIWEPILTPDEWREMFL